VISVMSGRDNSNKKNKKTLYKYSSLSLFHGSIIPDVTKLEVVKRLELDWTPLLISETGTGRLDFPDSDEIWDYQTRLRGDWIPCL
jgi:hypothetical protein